MENIEDVYPETEVVVDCTRWCCHYEVFFREITTDNEPDFHLESDLLSSILERKSKVWRFRARPTTPLPHVWKFPLSIHSFSEVRTRPAKIWAAYHFEARISPRGTIIRKPYKSYRIRSRLVLGRRGSVSVRNHSRVTTVRSLLQNLLQSTRRPFWNWDKFEQRTIRKLSSNSQPSVST